MPLTECRRCAGDGRALDPNPFRAGADWCRCGGDGNAFDPSPIGKARDFCLGCNGARLVTVVDPAGLCPHCRGDGKGLDRHPEHDSVTNWGHACQGTRFAS